MEIIIKLCFRIELETSNIYQIDRCYLRNRTVVRYNSKTAAIFPYIFANCDKIILVPRVLLLHPKNATKFISLILLTNKICTMVVVLIIVIDLMQFDIDTFTCEQDFFLQKLKVENHTFVSKYVELFLFFKLMTSSE